MRLSLADDRLVGMINNEIRAGRVRNRSGNKVSTVLGGALVREDGQVLYPIVDDIPIMLLDEAIALDQVNGRNDGLSHD